jgi:hypothetical protein
MENQQPQTQQPQTQQPNPDLTIVDLQNIRAIIDVAARRGAFGAAEMTAVGATFTKLDAFVNAVAPEKQDQNIGSPAKE